MFMSSVSSAPEIREPHDMNCTIWIYPQFRFICDCRKLVRNASEKWRNGDKIGRGEERERERESWRESVCVWKGKGGGGGGCRRAKNKYFYGARFEWGRRERWKNKFRK